MDRIFAKAPLIFRGRYREGFDAPKAITVNNLLTYELALPNASRVFRPGHRIMVQVQSSWLPPYDPNPQTFVPNIFFARADDHQKTTQRITVAGSDESFIASPLVR